MDFYLFSITCLKYSVGPESFAKMQRNNFFKRKLAKKKTGTIKFRNGCQKSKKILKLLKPSLMSRVNKISMSKIGEKIMRFKIQDHNL